MNKKIEELPAHSKLGASSADRWIECPGSVRLCASLPPAPTSSYAAEGSIAHDIAAHFLEKGYFPKGELDPVMIEHVTTYIAFVQGIWKKVKPHPKSKHLVEKKFHLKDLHADLFGTSDDVIYDYEEKTLHVTDFKYGAGVAVDAEENVQLMYYGLGALFAMGDVPIEKIYLHIVQPRIQSGPPIKTWECDPIVLFDFSVDLTEYAKRTEAPDAGFKTGDHCRWCSAKIVCPAVKADRQIAAKAEFQKENLGSLTRESVAFLLEKLPALEAWITAVREFAYLEAKHGRVPPGYKLVSKRATRKWADPNAAVKQLERMVHPTAMSDCMTTPELKSPAQVEKVLGKQGHELVASLVVSVSSGDTLVADSDARQEITRGAKADFALE